MATSSNRREPPISYRHEPPATSRNSAGGRALFDAIDTTVHRAFRLREPADTDLLWYLWAGPLSPLFGKDKMTTLERRLIADESTHVETKNPSFKPTKRPSSSNPPPRSNKARGCKSSSVKAFHS